MEPRTRTASVRVFGALIAVALGLLAVLAFVEYYGFGPDDLDRYEDIYGIDLPEFYGELPMLLTWSKGDGQAFVTVGADLNGDGAVLDLGRPNYRYSRIGYALVARTIALGNIAVLPIGLLATNLACLAVMGWYASRMSTQLGTRSYALLLMPGALIATAGSTAEALGLVLAVGGLFVTSKLGRVSAALLGIVRPDFATVMLLRGKEGLLRVLLCAVGAVSVRGVGWALGLGGTSGLENFAFPGAGYIAVVSEQPAESLVVTALLGIVGMLAIAQGLVTQRGVPRLAFVSTGIFVLMLGPAVLADPLNSLRATAAVPLLWLTGHERLSRDPIPQESSG